MKDENTLTIIVYKFNVLKRMIMESALQIIEEFKQLYCLPRHLLLKNYKKNIESAEYGACEFDLNYERIHFRVAKITPTKIGQFVTCWKRDDDGITAPYDSSDTFASFIIYTKTQMQQGVFIFPKEALLKHDILSDNGKGGKRGFRVYPVWDRAENAQAKKTQAWQIKYFTMLHH